MSGPGLLSVAERIELGHGLRRTVPRSAHGIWAKPPARRDPVDILIATSQGRIPDLLPLRWGRMRQTPFSFLRGAAAVMAADLAGTPATGLRVQACGDCHLMNFGSFASAEGIPVFDVNDFDETLPAPFEWDIKRLSTSLAVAARTAGLSEKTCNGLAVLAASSYRQQLGRLARLTPLDSWTSHIDLAGAVARVRPKALRSRTRTLLHEAAVTGARDMYHLLERTPSGWVIREKPGLVQRLVPGSAEDDATREIFAAYPSTLPPDRRVLIDRYRLHDVARKVVGVGSVGTFCAVGLFSTADDEPLLLQMKQAQDSVLAPYAGPSACLNQGERVVTGQRLMQATLDSFLGWGEAGDGRHFYVRRLKDSRLAAVAATLQSEHLEFAARLCGRTLARAHARGGDAADIFGYLGEGSVFDAAIGGFAMSYADQTIADHRGFLDAIASGRIDARDH